MSRLFADTDPEAEAILLRRMREMTLAQKMEVVRGLNRMARTLALAGLRQRHPEGTEAQIERRLMDLILGEELAAKVYGPREDTGG